MDLKQCYLFCSDNQETSRMLPHCLDHIGYKEMLALIVARAIRKVTFELLTK
jgi:hypothetical protein